MHCVPVKGLERGQRAGGGYLWAEGRKLAFGGRSGEKVVICRGETAGQGRRYDSPCAKETGRITDDPFFFGVVSPSAIPQSVRRYSGRVFFVR